MNTSRGLDDSEREGSSPISHSETTDDEARTADLPSPLGGASKVLGVPRGEGDHRENFVGHNVMFKYAVSDIKEPTHQ